MLTKKHVLFSVIARSLSVMISFAIIPISIDILGPGQYGLWIAVYSSISLFNVMSFGIGHGLRNHVTKAIADNNPVKAREYISTGYISVLSVCIVIGIIYLVFERRIDYQGLFNVDERAAPGLDRLMILVVVSFLFSIVVRLIDAVSLAVLESSIPAIINLSSSVVILVALLILRANAGAELFLYGTIIITAQLVISLVFTLYLFGRPYASLRPSMKSMNIRMIPALYGLGLKFFVLQMAAVVLYASDNLIIIHLLSPEDVTLYHVSHKYYGIFVVGISLVMGPLWSAVAHAKASMDMQWIGRAVKLSMRFVTGSSVVIVVWYALEDAILQVWIPGIELPHMLSVIMALYVFSTLYLQVFSTILNGLSKVTLQMMVGVGVAVLNIPLSIFLVVDMGMDTAGVILATLICNLICLAFLPLQYTRIFKGTAKGVWNA